MRVRVPTLLAGLSIAFCAAAADPVRLDVFVHHADGTPVEGAEVSGLFFTDQVLNRQNLPSHKGITDAGGRAEISGRDPRRVEVYVTREGYYRSKGEIVVHGIDRGRLDVEMRRRLRPLAMHARGIQFLPVAEGSEVGFDLEAGDYVAPYGRGSIADLLLTIRLDYRDFWNFDYRLELRFSNEGDGLIPFEFDRTESEYKMAYEAPQSGYRGAFDFFQVARDKQPLETNIDKRRNYFLRVRTVVDADGEVESAHYGKIYGDFPRIVYYFNPQANDRGLEFDTRRNLLRGLEPADSVTLP